MANTGLDIPPDMVCTHWLNGWPTWLGGNGHEWLPCCQAHDTAEMTFASAVKLGVCVAHVSPVMGFVMAVGVAVFGPVYLLVRQAQISRGRK